MADAIVAIGQLEFIGATARRSKLNGKIGFNEWPADFFDPQAMWRSS